MDLKQILTMTIAHTCVAEYVFHVNQTGSITSLTEQMHSDFSSFGEDGLCSLDVEGLFISVKEFVNVVINNAFDTKHMQTVIDSMVPPHVSGITPEAVNAHIITYFNDMLLNHVIKINMFINEELLNKRTVLYAIKEGGTNVKH